MEPTKQRVALAADEAQMAELLDWAAFNRDLLADYEVYTTSAAMSALTQVLEMDVRPFQQQNGRRRNEAAPSKMTDIDLLILFLNPKNALTGDEDIKALLTIARSRRIPIAGNRSAANHMFPAGLSPGAEQH